MAAVITLQCCVCGKDFDRKKSDHLRSIQRGRKKTCCSIDCARQSRRKPEGTKRRARSLKSKERCFKCGDLSIKIIHTSVNGQNHRLRRKECTSCGERLTTYEIPSEQYEEGLKPKNKEPLCHNCELNTGSKCSLGLPEYMTSEAYDCLHG